MSHLSLDQLGDVDAVAGHPHLTGCRDCREVLDEQRAVRELLGSLPGPGATPPDVVLAIEAALREAAPAHRAGGADQVTPLLGAAQPLRLARDLAPRSRLRRAAVGAGTLLVGVAAAGLVVTAVSRLPAGGSATSSAGSAAGAASAGASTTPSPTPSAGPAASRLTSGAADSSPRPLVAAGSGTRYAGATLVQQVRAVLGPALPAAAPAAATTRRLRTAVAASGGPADLTGCLRRLGARGVPLAADVATFDARPAAVLVVRDDRRSSVLVVSRDCGATRGTLLASAPLR